MPESSSAVKILQKTALLLAILAAGTQLRAQTRTDNARVQDPFGQWNASLRSAADNLLAATTQRPDEAPPVIPFDNAAVLSAQPQLAVSHATRQRSWQRVAQLRALIEPILHQQGVPAELFAVVLVESGGQPAALSPKGARGLWQFMPDTARRYGLVVDRRNDERLDVLKSTRAAARYLRDLQDRFADWSLALAAYNAGEDAVQRALERTGANNFAGLGPSLPPETQHYVPAVIAAARSLRRQSARRMPGGHQSGTGQVIYASVEVQN